MSDIPGITTQNLELVSGGPHDGMTLSVTSSKNVVAAITFTTQDGGEGWDYQISWRRGAPPAQPHITNVLRALADQIEEGE